MIVIALAGLTSAGHLVAQAPPAATGSTAPFFTGVTDPVALTTLVNEHLAAGRGLLGQLTSAPGRRSAEQTLRTYDNIIVHINAARDLTSVVRQLHPDAAMRTAAETLGQAAESFETELALNPAAYAA
ncbi:MAG: hypothetical protein Q8N52_03895, partial [Acidobacteriota bacterium]|nr:hypothetical protein [Acidobacteriota bacterium]